jgi:hypothetical protein
MSLLSEKEIEEGLRSYLNEPVPGDPRWTPRRMTARKNTLRGYERDFIEQGFKACAKFAEKAILNKAASGFEEWVESQGNRVHKIKTTSGYEVYGRSMDSWTAALLSAEKDRQSTELFWKLKLQDLQDEHEKEIQELETENQRLRTALEFYAKPENWTIDGHPFIREKNYCVEEDEFLNQIREPDWNEDRIGGKRAREALKGEVK